MEIGKEKREHIRCCTARTSVVRTSDGHQSLYTCTALQTLKRLVDQESGSRVLLASAI